MSQKIINRIELMSRRIRRRILDMAYAAGASGAHIGGALSIVELLATLYSHVLKYDPSNPTWEKRDRFILSKGHNGIALYAVLAEVGILSQEEIDSFQKSGSMFTTHPIMNRQKGIEFSNGSLGMGLSLGAGLAMAAKIKGQRHRVLVCMGDGECNEGNIWEAAMTAAHYNLDNMIALIDKNTFQLGGSTDKIMNTGELALKWAHFGWNVVDIEGHDVEQILCAFDEYRMEHQPWAIILNTTKGKGFSFSENNNAWHNGVITKSQYDAAVKELDSQY
jgi:transketolase